MVRRNKSVKTAILLGIYFCVAFLAFSQDDDSLEEAKTLYKEAVDLKKSGKTDQAIDTYEKAIRTNRSVLAEDDLGLVKMLNDTYEMRLASAPEDIKTLEGLAFINAVCYSNLENALKFYKKVIDLTKDDKVKKKTAYLVDRLTAMYEMTKTIQEDTTSKFREERLKEWTEMEKQQYLAQESEANENQARFVAELYKTKDDLETRIPQMEEEIKNLEEEFNKATRLWRTTDSSSYDHSNLYYRKRDRLEKQLEEKKTTLSESQKKLEEASRELDKFEKDSEKTAKDLGKKNAPQTTGTGTDTSMEQGSENQASATPNLQPDDQGSQPTPPPDMGITTQQPPPNIPPANPSPDNASATNAPPPDPALPPSDNPDFPPDPNAPQAPGK